MQETFSTDQLVKETPEVKEDDTTRTNKAAAIRNALKVLPNDVRNDKVMDYVFKEYGIRVSVPYINTVKYQITKRIAGEMSFEALRLARKLIRETGDINSAKAALDGVALKEEQDKSVIAGYQAQIAEIELLLGDDTRKMGQGDKNDLLKEKARLQKVLKVLEEN